MNISVFVFCIKASCYMIWDFVSLCFASSREKTNR